ncbi:MAG: hypothetical protein JO199_09640, partial [Candidatus Eremiobacteraeota bacterium]|nr:hypothetical protein [Candidatus Eremiobacteraeota bacterium]
MKHLQFSSIALVAAIVFAGCSVSTSASVGDGSSSDATTASSADSTSTSSDASAAPVYPGATPAEKSSYGTPPPGGKLYVTSDDPV